MRIAAKRLRYVLEITAGCFGPEAEALRGAARELQGVLGEIHDCDVMLPRVAGHRVGGGAAADPARAALRPLPRALARRETRSALAAILPPTENRRRGYAERRGGERLAL